MAFIQKISNEILIDILGHIEAGGQVSVAIDRREHLSVESFRPPTPPPKSQAQDVGNFRLCCRRFSELGIPYQFSRISLRFSTAGFERLDKISDCRHLTRHTRKFSYLVPPFYTNSTLYFTKANDSTDKTLASQDSTNGEHSHFSNRLERRVSDQRRLLSDRVDVRVLKKAMRSFTGLQHVQLLRLIEPAEISVRGQTVHLEWPPACSHASRTLGEALLSARSPFCRFSGPMMEPHTARIIQEKVLSLLASKLTCLELHFDGGPELADRMLELSSLASTVLRAATNLQAIHVGFPSRTPLDLRLDSMFHNICWDNLRAFGIQAWRLDSAEIVNLVKRHRNTLRGLRLRDVQLKKGSRWSDVLTVLRREMRQLEWVSLRRIDYADHFDNMYANTMEVPDDMAGGATSEDGSPDDDNDDDDEPYEWASDLSDNGSVGESLVEDSDEESTADTDHGPEADDIAISPDTPNTLPFCTCDRRNEDYDNDGADELGDNGTAVTHPQRKMWERWVLGRCPEHP